MTQTRRRFLKISTLSIAAGASGWVSGVFAEDAPAKWDMTTDVIVAGSGPAGMAAAIAALDEGVKNVVVFEKGKNYGGCGVICAGILQLEGGTKTQKANGVDDSPEKYYARMTNPNDPGTLPIRMDNPKITKRMTKYLPQEEEWMVERGVKFRPSFSTGAVDAQHPGQWHHIWWKEEGEGYNMIKPNKDGYVSGAGIMIPLREYFEKNGGKLFLEHKLIDVIKDDQNKVIGALILDPAGKMLKVKADKGVVLAGGGFRANVEMRKLVDSRLTENLIGTGVPFVVQDGSAIQAGLRAGGSMVRDGMATPCHHLRRKFGTAHYNFPLNSKYGAPGLEVAGPRWAQIIFTNKNGERFVREEDKLDLGGGFNFYDAALDQPDQFLWIVFDDATAKRFKWSTKPPVVEEGLAFTAPTIDELAKITNQPKLPETVNRYNQFVENKKDEDFNKPENLLTKKIETAPFHAVRCILAVHNMTAGLGINENGQVLDHNQKPIPGLYAAGENAGAVPFGGVTGALAMGRIAGTHIAGGKLM